MSAEPGHPSHQGGSHQVGKLVAMANQIGGFFATQRGDHAAADIAVHLRRFWTPRMRAAIAAHVAGGGAGLSAPAAAAVRLLEEGTTAMMTKT